MHNELKNLLITEYIKHNYDWSNTNLDDFVAYSKYIEQQFNKYLNSINSTTTKAPVKDTEYDLN